jgi:nicotinamide riboside transporter PnuC
MASILMKRFLGWFLIVAGTIVTLVGLVALLDPVATQMADDGNAFGPPGPWYESAILVVVGVAVCVAGTYVKRK